MWWWVALFYNNTTRRGNYTLDGMLLIRRVCSSLIWAIKAPELFQPAAEDEEEDDDEGNNQGSNEEDDQGIVTQHKATRCTQTDIYALGMVRLFIVLGILFG